MSVAARIAGKHTRAELGMKAPLSRSFNISPGAGGSTLHWGGPGSTLHSHDTCKAIWRGWQAFHMGPERGWADIAYTMGFCQHGWVFPGRGYGVRTAAQGTNRGNDVSYAFCHLNEAGHDPSALALSAAAWLVQDARVHGGAGMRCWAHWDWHSTDCPGPVVAALAMAVDDHPVGGQLPAPRVPPDLASMVHDMQEALHGAVAVDHVWGPATDRYVSALHELQDGLGPTASVKQAQAAVGVAQDGDWGPDSAAAYAETVRALQGAWRFAVASLMLDGAWGPATEEAYSRARELALGTANMLQAPHPPDPGPARIDAGPEA